MTARAARRLAKTSKLSVGLAAGTTAAVGTAAALGHNFSGPEVAGAFAVAGGIAAINFRHRPEAQPHVLTPVPEVAGELVVMAPRARTILAHPANHSDAA